VAPETGAAFRGAAQSSAAEHTHNTSGQIIAVLYPFHPLVGQRFLPIFVNEKPRRSFRVQLAERRLTIPAWMTEEPAASCELQDAPLVSVDVLLDLAGMVDHARIDLSPSSSMKRESADPGEDQIDEQETAATASRGGRRTRRSATRSRSKGNKGHGETGSASASDRRREGGSR